MTSAPATVRQRTDAKDQPKSNNLFWFLVGGGILAAAFIFRSPYVAYSLYAFLLLVLIANVTSRAWLAGLDCSRVVSRETVRQGEEVEVECTIENNRGFPIPWIFVEDFTPEGFEVTGSNKQLAILMPGRKIELKYTLLCPKRGYHRVGPLLMESGDLFGLQRRFRTGQQQHYISVLPTIAYIDTYNIASRRPMGPVKISNRIYEDPTRISSLREYVAGDPLNRIHWKASAKTGELFVKQSEPSNVLGGTIVLDLFQACYQGEDGEERMELAITTAASLAYLLHSSGEQVGMITNARDAAEVAQYDVRAQQTLSRDDAQDSVVGELESIRLNPLTVPTQRSAVQAQIIAENLARVLPSDGLDAGTLLMAEFPRLPRDAALLPILPQVTDDLAQTLATMKYSGFAVTVFLIKNPRGFDSAASLLAAHDIGMFHIEHERHLHEIAPQRIGR
jgi:uncharacterized protein (DUF58 family)